MLAMFDAISSLYRRLGLQPFRVQLHRPGDAVKGFTSSSSSRAA
jgi:hypothetical protein